MPNKSLTFVQNISNILKELFKKYKSVVRFVVLFMGTYLLLGILYSVYLNVSTEGENDVDFLTGLVARQSNSVLTGLGFNSELIPRGETPSLTIHFEGRDVGQIVEGCNAVSVIILFVAFVIAFAENFKKTALFILGGAVLIYCINILRIAILSVALFYYPSYEKLLHAIIFPGIIYGLVFLLWMAWVRTLKLKVHNGQNS